jgi:hypothetical protein
MLSLNLFCVATVFSAYVYYVVRADQYQAATSYIKAAALLSCVLSGILGDILVVEGHTSLRILMWISAAGVWAGFAVGLIALRPTNKASHLSNAKTSPHLDSKSVRNHPSPSILQTTCALSPTEAAAEDPRLSFLSSAFDHQQSMSGAHFDTNTSNATLAQLAPTTTPVYTWKQKLALFKSQLQCLRIAIQSRTIAAMLWLWILGNAMFSVRQGILCR